MDRRIVLAAKVVGLSGVAALAVVFASSIGGWFLYILLEPQINADDLSSFALFFLPFIGLGLPSLVVASRLALLRTHCKAQFVLVAATLVFGTLGFAGFWVGAMGI